ncbi:glycoside hydrolase family 28 protein [Hymenobacter sp.]|jgi:polygalacturonase|uniref:glycoside hydrolase family 28 protein n=1 Tax=Hymenobacter sp. TaxID=1898978 RepID=UPI002ED950E6
MHKLPLLFLLLLLAGSGFGQKASFNITSYGAKPDGETNNGEAIQKAIDEAATRGGRVVVPAGQFVTGPLHLKSGVELHLNRGAFLLGSTKRLDYSAEKGMAMLIADSQQNLAITGQGVIDGQGRQLIQNLLELLRAGTLEDPEWKIKRPTERNRTHLINFDNCNGVRITGVTLKDASSWVQAYRQCRNMVFDSIRVESTAYWNNDGIDFVDCRNVRLTNSFFNTADDGICLKSEDASRSCDSIYVADCTVRSSASAFKLGTGSLGGFRRITVRNLTVYDTFRSAIALEAVDGAVLEDIDIRNVMGRNTGNAIFIRLGQRKVGAPAGTVRRVYIANVKVEVPAGKPDKGYEIEGPVYKEPHNVNPSSVTGLPGHPVQDVTLENIDITYAGGANKTVAYASLDSLSVVPERAPNYPEFSMFGELPAYGFYVRHAEGLTLKNVRIRTTGPDYRPALVFDDVQKLTLQDVTIPTAPTTPVVVLQEVTSLSMKKLTTPVSKQKAVQVLSSKNRKQL